jgi:hypothetical protein
VTSSSASVMRRSLLSAVKTAKLCIAEIMQLLLEASSGNPPQCALLSVPGIAYPAHALLCSAVRHLQTACW